MTGAASGQRPFFFFGRARGGAFVRLFL